MRNFIAVLSLAVHFAVCKATDVGCTSGEPADVQCLYCDATDATKCGMCKQGHFLDGGKCTTDACEDASCDLGCLDADTCCNVTDGCNECTAAIGTCTSCMPDKYFDVDTCKDCNPACVGACLNGTPEGCCPEYCAECEAASRSAAHTCTLCFNGLKAESGTCSCATTTQNAKSVCVTCNSDKTECTECAAKYKKVAGKCVKCDAECDDPVSCNDDGSCPAGNDPTVAPTVATTKPNTEDSKNTTTSSGAKGLLVAPLFAITFFFSK